MFQNVRFIWGRLNNAFLSGNTEGGKGDARGGKRKREGKKGGWGREEKEGAEGQKEDWRRSRLSRPIYTPKSSKTV